MTITPQNTQEYMDRYLMGQMSDEEERGFKALLESDSGLADDMGLMCRIMRTISTRACRYERMERWDNETCPAAATAAAPAVPTHPWMRWVAMAASLVLVVVLSAMFITYRSGDGQSAPVKGVAPASATSAMRGGSDDVLALENQLNDINKAATFALSDINTTISGAVPQQGLRPEEAEYEQILLNHDVYQLRWLRIKALISAGRISEAKIALKKYAAEDGYNQDEAKKLLKQFEAE
ncbi:MAG: hypothetical protein NC339_05820 [Muribaculaceae bacterium]|nr:hypothetical protein [Muribaculaceae bacterium]